MDSKILIIDDNKFFCEMKRGVIQDAGYTCDYSLTAEEGLEKLKSTPHDLVLLDLEIGSVNGIDVLPEIKEIDDSIIVLILTGHTDIHTAVDAVKKGAYDYISKEVGDEEILLRIEKALDKRNDTLTLQNLKRAVDDRYKFQNIIGKNKKMSDIFGLVETVSDTDVTVLITGETGTGKELIARAIHFNSQRKNQPFWEVNCTAISETLMESEVFGHEKGAFTGAFRQKPGKIELANKGTLFLDEIGDMPLALQGKLLRFLQDKVFERVGGTEKLTSDVRIVSATHRDLEKMIEEEKFREDLYYRLNVVKIEVPPLRERIDDLPMLIDHFLQKANSKYKKDISGLSKAAFEIAASHTWQGNVRELENLIEKIVLTAKDNIITPEEIQKHLKKPKPGISETKSRFNFDGSLETLREQVEVEYLKYLMQKFHGNIRLIAETAGLDKRSIYYKIKQYSIDKI
jgi:DNA-binding NtrC family response regulator